MRDVTAEEVEASIKQKGITMIVVRQCSLCDYDLKYIVEGDNLYFDSGCNCVRHPSPPQPREWGELAWLINMQSQDKHKAEMAKLVGIELS